MPRKFKKSGPKNPFDALPTEFQDAMAAAQTEELQTRLASIAKDEQANLASRDADADLKSKKGLAAEAGKAYSEASKINKLKTKFIIRVMADRGDPRCAEIQTLIAGKCVG